MCLAENAQEIQSDQKINSHFLLLNHANSLGAIVLEIRQLEESFLLNNCCDACELKNQCHKFLLTTPCSQIDLAVSMDELKAIKDLVEGTLFKINLEDYLNGAGMN